MERIVITFNADGTFRGASVNDHAGLPQPLDTDALTALFPTVNAAALARVAELEAEVEGIPAKDEEITSLQSQLAAANARIAELEAAPGSPESETLATLNAAYKAAVPEAMQTAFAPAYAIVRVLVQAGEMDQAKAYVESLEVPPELAEAKTGIIALLTP